MPNKLTEKLDLPKCVRAEQVLRAKLNVVRHLRRRNLAQQIRESMIRGVDQEFTELGKEAIELFCRQMSEDSREAAQTIPGPKSCREMPENVGDRRQKGAA